MNFSGLLAVILGLAVRFANTAVYVCGENDVQQILLRIERKIDGMSSSCNPGSSVYVPPYNPSPAGNTPLPAYLTNSVPNLGPPTHYPVGPPSVGPPAWLPWVPSGGIPAGITDDCDDVYDMGNRVDGAYNIRLYGRIVQVYCQFQKNGYNWLVFQRRASGLVDFYRTWKEYEEGFGHRNGEFWLGLSNLNHLTAIRSYRLRVDLEDFNGNTAYAEYSTFYVGDATTKYRLTVTGYTGTAGDSLMDRHNNNSFTTRDQDNDKWTGGNCAVEKKGAWWYDSCHHSNLNGLYIQGGAINAQGINWYYWKFSHYSMKKTLMKIRPN